MTTFRLHELHWQVFQDLANTVIGHKYNIPIKSFRGLGPDGGRDGAATTLDNKEWVVQAKHTSKRKGDLSMDRFEKLFIKEESKKIKRLVKNGNCHKYYAVTNYTVSPLQNERFKTKVKELGVEVADVIGKEDLSRWIPGMPPELRKNFPSLCSDENELFSESLKETYKESSKRFEQTASFTAAKTHLQSNCNNFVFLLGEEKSGKTSMMEQLALTSCDKETILIRALNAYDFKKSALKGPNFRIFMLDDIFGKLEIDIKETEMWDKVFEGNTILYLLKKTHNKIIMTSRNQIYEGVKDDISDKFREFLEDNCIDLSQDNDLQSKIETGEGKRPPSPDSDSKESKNSKENKRSTNKKKRGIAQSSSSSESNPKRGKSASSPSTKTSQTETKKASELVPELSFHKLSKSNFTNLAISAVEETYGIHLVKDQSDLISAVKNTVEKIELAGQVYRNQNVALTAVFAENDGIEIGNEELFDIFWFGDEIKEKHSANEIDVYFIATNYKIGRTQEEKLLKYYQAAGIKHSIILDVNHLKILVYKSDNVQRVLLYLLIESLDIQKKAGTLVPELSFHEINEPNFTDLAISAVEETYGIHLVKDQSDKISAVKNTVEKIELAGQVYRNQNVALTAVFAEKDGIELIGKENLFHTFGFDDKKNEQRSADEEVDVYFVVTNYKVKETQNEELLKHYQAEEIKHANIIDLNHLKILVSKSDRLQRVLRHLFIKSRVDIQMKGREKKPNLRKRPQKITETPKQVVIPYQSLVPKNLNKRFICPRESHSPYKRARKVY